MGRVVSSGSNLGLSYSKAMLSSIKILYHPKSLFLTYKTWFQIPNCFQNRNYPQKWIFANIENFLKTSKKLWKLFHKKTSQTLKLLKVITLKWFSDTWFKILIHFFLKSLCFISRLKLKYLIPLILQVSLHVND